METRSTIVYSCFNRNGEHSRATAATQKPFGEQFPLLSASSAILTCLRIFVVHLKNFGYPLHCVADFPLSSRGGPWRRRNPPRDPSQAFSYPGGPGRDNSTFPRMTMRQCRIDKQWKLCIVMLNGNFMLIPVQLTRRILSSIFTNVCNSREQTTVVPHRTRERWEFLFSYGRVSHSSALRDRYLFSNERDK